MDDEAAVSAVVRAYVEGMVFADEAKLRSAFHPDSLVIGNYEEKLEWSPSEEFIASVITMEPLPEGTPAPFEILSIDITGDAAAVKLTDDFAGMRFTDYLSLLRIDGHWRIVNKLYYHHA